MPGGDAARCFIAVPVPENVKAACLRAIETLRPHTSNVRWARPETMHLTLKFLGSVARSDIPALVAAVKPVVAAQPGFRLETGAIGHFGSARRPRVFWLGVAGDVAALHELQQAIDSACETRGYARDPRPYHAHLTLGRVKNQARMDDADWPARVAAPLPIRWTVQTVEVCESDTRPDGAMHSTIAVCSLVPSRLGLVEPA